MNLSWWCAAGSGAWTWTPQAYPGIWLFMLGLLLGWLGAARRLGPSRVEPGQAVLTGSQVRCFLAGWALLWIVLDWPLGALAAGYLLTAHMIQYVVIVLFVAPLLEKGVPDWMRRAFFALPLMSPARWLSERPFASYVVFNLVLVGTHVPLVADTLKPLQLGSMAIDLVWIASALLFWFSTTPVTSGSGVDAAHGKRLLYLAGIKVLPILLGAFLVFADFPIYRTYEFAARAVDLSARADQALAGWMMWAGTTPILVYRLGAAFFAWYALDAARAGEVPGPR